MNSSGAYPTVCVELSLDGLAVNAVLQVVIRLVIDVNLRTVALHTSRSKKPLG